MPEEPQHEAVVEFGQKLRSLREAAGISQENFARLVEVDRSYYSGVERGVRNPTLLMLIRFAKALKRPVRDFFF